MPRLDYERIGNLAFGGLLVVTNVLASVARVVLDMGAVPGKYWPVSLFGIACGGWLLYVWWSPRSKSFRPRQERSDVVFDLILGVAIFAGMAWMIVAFAPKFRMTLPFLFLFSTMAAWLAMGTWMISRAWLDWKLV